MKALITGAGGFLGQNLVNFLLDKDFEIFNLEKTQQMVVFIAHCPISLTKAQSMSI